MWRAQVNISYWVAYSESTKDGEERRRQLDPSYWPEWLIFGEEWPTNDDESTNHHFQAVNILLYKRIPKTGSPGVDDVEYPHLLSYSTTKNYFKSNSKLGKQRYNSRILALMSYPPCITLQTSSLIKEQLILYSACYTDVMRRVTLKEYDYRSIMLQDRLI